MKKTLIEALVWVACLVLLLVGITVWSGGAEPSPNCWDQYQTEEQAILHCENHGDN